MIKATHNLHAGDKHKKIVRQGTRENIHVEHKRKYTSRTHGNEINVRGSPQSWGYIHQKLGLHLYS